MLAASLQGLNSSPAQSAAEL